MNQHSPWRLSDFDYQLPAALIAQRPAAARDHARLLVSRAEGITDSVFHQIGGFLQPGDLLVLNDTKVFPARLFGVKPSGGRVELFLLRPLAAPNEWLALLGGGGKAARPGLVITIAEELTATLLERDGQQVRLRLNCSQDLATVLERHGHLPLPPYIRASDPHEDQQRYQTVVAQHTGAVAAPTAGLHFTPELLTSLRQAGIDHTCITLHVGLGTFQPVREELLDRHEMHHEWLRITTETAQKINNARQRGGRIVAVGTTVTRTLESIAEADGTISAHEGETNLFILPGYRFKVVQRMITNFHLPRSTLLMLVAAFVGKPRLDRDYRYAMERQFRFYSYGDTMLLFPDADSTP